MNRRPASRSANAERPRQKGWWGEPENNDQEQGEEESQPGLPREHHRKPAPSHAPRTITQVGRSLTPSQVEAIRTVMRLFVDDDTASGVDPRCTLLCHRCAAPRRAIGSVRYDRLTFCNACSTEYEIARARGLVESAAQYLERYAARQASA